MNIVDDSCTEDSEYEDENTCLPARKYNMGKVATNCVTFIRVLTNKVAKI